MPDPKLLLHPNIIKPLHGTAPRTVLGEEWWQKEKTIAKDRANGYCEACGVHKSKCKGKNKWLECHEVYDTDYVRGKATYIKTVALCPYCHAYIHRGLLEIQFEKKQRSAEEYFGIIAHGDRLTEFLERPLPPKFVAPWENWRLVIDGVEYKGKFNSIKDWAAYYSNR